MYKIGTFSLHCHKKGILLIIIMCPVMSAKVGPLNILCGPSWAKILATPLRFRRSIHFELSIYSFSFSGCRITMKELKQFLLRSNVKMSVAEMTEKFQVMHAIM